VRTFLAMARQQRPERGPVSMNEVVTEALDLAAYPIRTSSIDVTLDLSPDIPAIEADADQLHQVLLNLVINAQQSLQDRPGVRRIRIATSSVEIGAAAGGAPAPGEYVALLITTQGWGAAVAAQDQSAGVATARRAVGRLGGVLAVEAVSDESLTFRVYLPQASIAILTDDAQGAAREVTART